MIRLILEQEKLPQFWSFIKGFENSTGINLNYRIGDRRMGDVDQCFAEVSKANNVLNWKSHLSIEDALVSSWNWEKNINNEKL